MRFWITLCTTRSRQKPSVKFPTRSKFYNLQLPKSSENFQTVDCYRFQAQKRQSSKTRIYDRRGAAFIGKLQAALMPDMLECFSDWPEEKLDTFADQIRIFRTWLEENRV